MKNWLLNSCLLWMTFVGLAHANPIEDAYACLKAADLSCAIEIESELSKNKPNDVEVLQLSAKVYFHVGDFDKVLEALNTLEKLDVLVPDDGVFPARASQNSFKGMVETQGNGVRVRHDPGLDRILVQDALNTMESSRKVYALADDQR